MACSLKARLGKRSEEGMAAVEFAIVLSLFLMVLLGIVEFGYDWYMRHLLTDASRDGARWGSMYQTNAAGNRISASALTSPNRIEDVVNSRLNGLLPSGSWNVACSGAGYAGTTSGQDLIVTVRGTKTWSALGSFVPSLRSGFDMTATTTMKIE